MILAGRRINDAMAGYVARDIVKTMRARGQSVEDARVLMMGFTFKENCPDTRNTKIADLVQALGGEVAEVSVYDPLAEPEVAMREYNVPVSNDLPVGPFDAVVLAVAHGEIVALGADRLKALLTDGGLIYDIKGIVPPELSGGRI